jgi:hypothetical protein
VTYTVWLGDRLIGETDLADERVEVRYRSGNFFPIPGNETFVPTTDPLLQLRDESGAHIPTDWMTVYDLDADPIDGEDDVGFVEPFDEELDAAIEHDAALIREWIEGRDSEDDESDGDLFSDEFSRYQIQLKLAKGASIP